MNYPSPITVPTDVMEESFSRTSDNFVKSRRHQAAHRRHRQVVPETSATDWGSEKLWWEQKKWDEGASTAPTQTISLAQKALSNSEFAIVLSRVSDLLKDDEDFQPTEYTLRNVLSLLFGAFEALGYRFTRAAVAVGEDGDVSVYWRNARKRLQLTVPAQEGQTFLYRQDSTGHTSKKNIAVADLTDWLRWFMDV